jgi:hypothetical protein
MNHALTLWLMVPEAHEAPVTLEDLPGLNGTSGPRAGDDTDQFFPSRGASTERAKAMCDGCEVRPECLAVTMADSDASGIWGGLSDRQRKPMRKAACLGVAGLGHSVHWAILASGWFSSCSAVLKGARTRVRRPALRLLVGGVRPSWLVVIGGE